MPAIKSYFWYVVVTSLLLSGCALASPERPDEREVYGEIHTEVGENFFRLLDIVEGIQYNESTQMYEYTITLSEQVYSRVANGDVILRVAFSGGCECDGDKALLTLELTSKVNRLSSSKKASFYYSAEFEEDYLEFEKNNHYFFKRSGK